MAIELACEAVGDGPPVVILHGLFGAGRNWSRIAQALAATHRVYLPDARNHGASPRGQTMSYADMAHDVLALMERERIKRPFLVGHSMGGKTAMTLALEHPKAISGVAVVDLAAALGREEAMEVVARGMDGGTPVDFMVPRLLRYGERFDWRLNLLAVAMCMRDLSDFASPARRRYDGPALFLAGAHSDYVRPDSHARIARLFPRARLQTVAGAGHWVHADQPEALLRMLRDWLDAPAARGPVWQRLAAH